MSDMLGDSGIPLFLIMVFVAVFLLAQSLMVSTVGADQKAAKRLRRRIGKVADEFAPSAAASLLRDKYLRELSPLERALESLPGMERLARMIEQSGRTTPAYRLVLVAAGLACAGAVGAWVLSHEALAAAGAGALGGAVPFVKIARERDRRLAKFEEQLPEAMDIMTRALRAGHPFNETLRLVAEELDAPVAREFGLAFADINYGTDVRVAFLNLLERVPSVALMSLVTSVLVQRETGGNLAEILEKIGAVVRGRFRFQRKVKTLTAEGRLSAWVLTMVPFALFAVMSLTSPGYLPVLLVDPLGRKLIGGAFVLMLLGILWMRKLIRIEV